MKYREIFSRKVKKNIKKLPVDIQKKFACLVVELEAFGPVQPKWKNFSKLGENEYHCHLGYPWVACWYHEKKEIIIEVYYVGSRENAPY